MGEEDALISLWPGIKGVRDLTTPGGGCSWDLNLTSGLLQRSLYHSVYSGATKGMALIGLLHLLRI